MKVSEELLQISILSLNVVFLFYDQTRLYHRVIEKLILRLFRCITQTIEAVALNFIIEFSTTLIKIESIQLVNL